MRGEIIAIGDELTSGRILNSTSNFAARHLFGAGHDIIAMHTIGDDMEIIGEFLQRALARADFIIVTGGLGSTTDDLTNEAVSDAFDLPVTFYPEIYEKVNSGSKNFSVANAGSEADRLSLEKLAWLPEGAKVLKPSAHMAGYMLVQDGIPIFFLPGVPHEMKELLADVVIPHLAATGGKAVQVVKHKLYKVLGLGETAINEKLSLIEKMDDRVRVGYYPVFPEVHVSLTVREKDRKLAENLFEKSDAAIVAALDDSIFGYDGDTMEGVVGQLLLQKKKTLATAESCTGGLVSHAITKISGSSEYFVGGAVTYSNEMKESFLGVAHETLIQFGAVSPEVAREMAAGIRKKTGADIAISVTGIAGPTGGSQDKPVGTVCFGLATQSGFREYSFHFKGGRWKVQHHASHTALDIVRRYLLAS
jgi:nicotinamide-nucleotide amidase